MLKLFKQPLSALFLFSLLFISCGEDKDEVPDEDKGSDNNSETFNINNYNLNGGVIYDYGFDGDHYNYDFVLYDGDLNTADETFVGPFYIYTELYSAGSNTSFQAGTFNYIDWESIDEIIDKNYFDFSAIVVDGNGNNTLFLTNDDAEKDSFYVPVSGSVTVTDNGNNNYTLAYDLQIAKADFDTEAPIEGTTVPLKFTSTLTFTIVDETSGRLIETRKKIFLNNK